MTDRISGSDPHAVPEPPGGASGCARFRALHHRAEPLLLPNAWDHASVAALSRAGFAAVGTTSLGVAAAAGKPDADGATLPETLALARAAARLPCLLSVDLEAGFDATPEGVADLAAQLTDLGVVGINIEDGRADGTLAETRHQVAVIGAVKARVPELFVNARTDAYWLGLDPPLPAALDRISAYAAAGADCVFVPGIADDQDIRSVVGHAGVPVNVLFLPGRHTVHGLAALGVRRISLGSLLYRAALHATVRTAQDIAAGRPVPAGLPSYADVTSLIG